MSGFMLVSYVALWVLVAVMAVLLVLLYRHFGMMSLGTLEGVQRDGLPVGSVAPTISGITAEGADKGWDPKTGRYQLLLFAAPDCEPCATVMPHVNRLGRSRDAGVDVAAIVPGPKSEAVRMVNRYDPPFTTLAEDGSGAFGRFRVRVTPFGFIIGPDGRILAKGLCGDIGRLGNLLHAAGLKDAAALLQATAQPMTLVTSNAGGIAPSRT
jgi:thiol-disulfide isomerase/thioredoxin